MSHSAKIRNFFMTSQKKSTILNFNSLSKATLRKNLKISLSWSFPNVICMRLLATFKR